MPDLSNQDAAGSAPRSANPDPRLPLRSGEPGETAVTDPHHMLPEQASEPPHKGGRRLIIVVVLILAVIAFIVWRVHSNNVAAHQQDAKRAAAANRPTPVQTAVVQQKTVPVFLTALGTATAYNTVTLRSRVDGQLLQVNFHEGQVVHKGQLLLQIDPRPYQAAVDQAIGTLAKDEANLKNMQAQAQRYTALYQAGVVSKEQQQLQVANEGQAAGSIKADQAAIEGARVNLGYTRIYAPIDGIVGLRLVDPGNIVHSSDTTGLVVITQVHPIAIIFTLPEDQIEQVQEAMKGGSKLVVEAYDRTDAHKIATGTLLTIDNQIDTATGTAKLKSVFDNSDGSLFPNEFLNVRLILRQRPDSIVVPTAAIETGNQGDYVFVVNPGPTPPDKLANQPGATAGSTTTGNTAATAETKSGSRSGKGESAGKRAQYHADIVPVKVAFTLGTDSVIETGPVDPGKQVVVDGQEKLVDGGNVSPQLARTIPTHNSGDAIGGTTSPSAGQSNQKSRHSGSAPSGGGGD